MAALTVLLCGCAAFSANTSDAPKLRFPGHVVARADDTQLDLGKLGHEDVAAAAELLLQMPELKVLDLGSDGVWTGETPGEAQTSATAGTARDLTWEDLRTLQEATPKAELVYRFRFCGQDFTTADEEMDLSSCTMTDNGAEIREILPLMKKCKYVDMDSCGVPSETMAEIRDDYPEMDVVWRIWFALGNFTVRTDIERLWCANFYSFMSHDYVTELKYCTKLKQLDLGHNLELHDWSFLKYMPDLEVLILTASGWEDLEMISNCTKLEYLEAIPMSHVYVDLKPLEKLTNLEHLNICGMGETDGWEVLLNMKKLKRLWIGRWTAAFFPDGAIEQLREALPSTEINVTEWSGATGSWRQNPNGSVPERYRQLSEEFDYDHWPKHAPYAQNDPKYNPPWER